MVAKRPQVVQPALRCDVCHRRFLANDKAVCIVRVPYGDFDTVCTEDWAITLAAASSALKDMGTLDQSALKRLLLDALDMFGDSNDELTDEVAQAVKQALSKGQTS